MPFCIHNQKCTVIFVLSLMFVVTGFSKSVAQTAELQLALTECYEAPSGRATANDSIKLRVSFDHAGNLSGEPTLATFGTMSRGSRALFRELQNTITRCIPLQSSEAMGISSRDFLVTATLNGLEVTNVDGTPQIAGTTRQVSSAESEPSAVGQLHSSPNTSPLVYACDKIASVPLNPDNQPGFTDHFPSPLEAEKAVRICQEAVQKFPEHNRSRFQLGASYLLLKDYANALKHFQIASDAGYAIAMAGVADLYFVGNGVEQDYKIAMLHYRRAEIAGLEYAKYLRAHMLLNGFGITVDETKGYQFLLKGIQERNPVAQYILGSAYLQGTGIQTDAAEGLRLLKLVAEAGHHEAYLLLGYSYRMGWAGITKDVERAIEYFELASKAGSADTDNYIGYMYLTGEGVSKNYETALEYFRKGMLVHDGEAYYNLGYMYVNGTHVRRDYDRGRELYNQAYELGVVDGLIGLGLLYMRGQGVTRNYSRAADYFYSSLQQGSPWLIQQPSSGVPRQVAQEIQRRLSRRGLYSGAIDGQLGPNSRDAMQRLCDCTP